MVALAGVGNGIAQFWWTRSLSLAPPSAVAPFSYLSLVWATILGFAIWRDVPSPGLMVGTAIVAASGRCRCKASRQLSAHSGPSRPRLGTRSSNPTPAVRPWPREFVFLPA
jgi:hypothetical protein